MRRSVQHSLSNTARRNQWWVHRQDQEHILTHHTHEAKTKKICLEKSPQAFKALTLKQNQRKMPPPHPRYAFKSEALHCSTAISTLISWQIHSLRFKSHDSKKCPKQWWLLRRLIPYPAFALVFLTLLMVPLFEKISFRTLKCLKDFLSHQLQLLILYNK